MAATAGTVLVKLFDRVVDAFGVLRNSVNGPVESLRRGITSYPNEQLAEQLGRWAQENGFTKPPMRCLAYTNTSRSRRRHQRAGG